MSLWHGTVWSKHPRRKIRGTHGGQFLPWNFFVKLQQPFVTGLRRLRNLWVVTSRGTGYWGPPNRFGIPSEITLLRLVPEG